jgi:hypothetical protein
LLAVWKQIANGVHTALSAAFFSLHTAVGNGAMNKFGICFQWRNEHFEPRMLIFSVGIGAMSAPQIGNGATNTTGCGQLHNDVSQSKNFYWLSIFLSTFPVISHSLSTLCVSCKYTLMDGLSVQVEGGGGGLAALQREWGTSIQHLKKLTEQTMLSISKVRQISSPYWQFVSK